ncbi:insulin receptor substrate 1-like [Aquarana catesbeiana]|uniref:insulin receptor substrate 1-like n=1 Tax=Aquarana catesbeiana TaxID=8400 RepID=UPI003CCA58FA
MEDVKKSGYLRKQKSMRKRYFVLRGPGPRGPARLEYYENEKKFRLADGFSGGPRGTVNLEEAFGVNKRADAKRRHLLVLYTRDGGLCVSADGEEEQEAWYQAILELQAQARSLSTSADASAWPVPPFREVWQVSVRPRGLGQTRNLSGTYRLCLTDRTLGLLRLRSDHPSVTLQLMNVRRCGHSDNYFFVEVGRSAVTGPGELWMQVEDSVVAQNMHETILEAMKSLSEEFRPRTKSQSLSSTPITVPSRRHLPNPPPPSQVGLSRRSRIEVSLDSSPAPKPHSLPRDHSPRSPEEEEKRPRVEAIQPPVDYGSASSDEYGSSPSLHEPPIFLPPSPVTGETNYISMGQFGRRSLALDLASVPMTSSEEDGGKNIRLELEDNYAMMGKCEPRPEAGYMPMLPGSRSQDYMPMTPNSISPPAPIELAGYVLMSPLGSCSPEQERTSWPPSGDMSVGSADSQASDYMSMWPLSRSASSTPPPAEKCLKLSNGPTRIPASYRSLPRSYKLDPVPPVRNSCSSSSDSLEEVSSGRSWRPLSMSVDTWRANTLPGNYRRPPSPGEYVSINFRAKKEKTKKDLDVPQAEYIAMDTQHPKVANGDYTKMTFEPETWRSQPPSVTDQKVEKASKTTPESMSGLVTAEVNSRSVSKKASRPTSTIEKTLKPSTEDDPWPMVASDNTFRPIAPADNKLSLTAKVPTEAQVDSALGLAEKTIATKPPSEDLELRGLLAGCSLYNGPDRNRLVRGDHPARTRHCSDNLSLNTVASCNGNRAQSKESGLNYIDLDLVKDVRTSPLTAYLVSANVPQPMKSGTLGANPCINTYASIDFQMSGELRRDSRDGTEC